VENRIKVGNHVISNFYGVEDLGKYNNKIKDALINACKDAGATVLEVSDHEFDNGGYTVLVLLAESHSSIHTYPEHKSLYFDVFTCGSSIDPNDIFETMKTFFTPAFVDTTRVDR
jgi:S-adenosylmethionine decarboxylase